MKDNAGTTKVKGTVLYTVVSVLMVLIVFLMGTLALAATASNRAHKNYQKEQTEYIARAVLDSVVAAMETDDAADGVKARIAAIPNPGDSTEINVFRSDSSATDADGNPVPDVVTVTKLEPQHFYNTEINPETNKPRGWEQYFMYELSTTITKTMAETTYSVIVSDASIKTIVPGGGSGAFVSMGTAIVPDQGVITGGTSVGLNTDGTHTFNIQNDPFTIESNVYMKGNLTLQNKGTFRFLGKDTHIAITGDLGYGNNIEWVFADTVAWDNHTETPYQDIPCVYVGGKFYDMQSVDLNVNNQRSPDTTKQPINLYCGYMEVDGNGFRMSGDIYAFDEDKTSIIGSAAGTTALYTWVNKNIKGSKYTNNYQFGNFYSKGNVVINVSNSVPEIQNNLFVRGDLDIQKDLNVTNTITCGKKMTVTGTVTCKSVVADVLEVNGTLTCDNIEANQIIGTGTINRASIRSKDLYQNPHPGPGGPGGPGAPGYVAPPFTMADGARFHHVNTTRITEDFKKEIYPEEFEKDRILDDIIDESSSYSPDQYQNYPQTLEDFMNKYGMTGSEAHYTIGSDTIPDVITNSCYLTGTAQASDDPNLYIKPEGKDIAVVIEGNFLLNGNNSIIVDESGGNVYFFIDTNATMEIGSSGSFITVDHLENIYNKTFTEQELLETQFTQCFKDIPVGFQVKKYTTPADPMYPNVYVFSGEGAKLTFPNASAVTANIRAPMLNFVYRSSGQELGHTVEYRDETGVRDFAQGEYVALIGQLIAGEIEVANQWGLLYVTTGSLGGDGGGGAETITNSMNYEAKFYNYY